MTRVPGELCHFASGEPLKLRSSKLFGKLWGKGAGLLVLDQTERPEVFSGWLWWISQPHPQWPYLGYHENTRSRYVQCGASERSFFVIRTV